MFTKRELNGDEEEKTTICPIAVIPWGYGEQENSDSTISMPVGAGGDVQYTEVVVVTEAGEEIVPEYDSYEEDEDIGSALAAEIEVSGGSKDIDSKQVTDFKSIDYRQYKVQNIRQKKSRFKRRNQNWTMKSPRKIYSTPVPSYDDLDGSDSNDYKSYRRSSQKPRKRDFAHRLQWRDKDMQDALVSVKEKKMTIRGAAKKYNVPYSTLKDRVKGRVLHGTKPGVKTVLSPEEEEELVKCIQQMESAGFHLYCIDIRERASELLNLNRGYNTPYRDTIPGHNWLAGFLKRHPGIEIKRSTNRVVPPSTAKQKQMLKKFFDVSLHAYRKIQGEGRSSRIYTMTPLSLVALPQTTIIITASANGTTLPPYVMLSCTKPVLSQMQQLYPEAQFSNSSSIQVKEEILLSWFRDYFLRKIRLAGNNRPSVLFLNQPISNISIRLVQMAADEQVQLVSIPSGISHLIQPLNEELLERLDDSVTKRSKKWVEERGETVLSGVRMADVLRKVWQKAFPPEIVIKNFTENGLFPLNIRAISNERIMSSMPSVCETSLNPSPSEEAVHGLTLLSELSSGYAIIDNVSEQTIKQEELDAVVDTDNETYASRYTKRPKRSHFSSPERSEPSIVEKRVSEELMKRILGNDEEDSGSCSRTRPTNRNRYGRKPDISRQVMLARDDPVQILQAIESISNVQDKNSTDERSYPSRNFLSSRLKEKAATTSHASVQHVKISDGQLLDTTPEARKRVDQNQASIKQEVCEESFVQEEFIPQEMVEEQTVLLNGYNQMSNVTEEVIEEIVELDCFDLPLEEGAIKLENDESSENPLEMECNAINEQFMEDITDQTLPGIFQNSDEHYDPNQQVQLIKCIKVNNREVQIIRTVSLQDALNSNFNIENEMDCDPKVFETVHVHNDSENFHRIDAADST